MDFTLEQQKLIYNAVRYYQMNRVPLNSNQYSVCDEILNGLFSEVRMDVPVAVPPHRPITGFGITVY
jgi:hypothetical protein